MVGVFSEGISCGLESEIVQLIQGARVVAFGWAWEESYETDSNLHKYTLTPLSSKNQFQEAAEWRPFVSRIVKIQRGLVIRKS
jgi:hypothetical protein